MKNSWIILGLLLLLIVCVGILVYPFAQGWVMGNLVLVSVLLLLIGIIVLVACIAWLVFRSRQKKVPEPEPKGAAIETPEMEPSLRPVKEVIDRGFKIIDSAHGHTIEGINSAYAEKLNSVNIYTTSDLLEAGATPLKRKELAEKTGISDKLILRWVNIADLLRIEGVGEKYADLLEQSGVDTVVELSRRIPENLHAKLLEVNEKKEIVKRPPTSNEVKQWTEEAKSLPRKIEY